MTENDQQIIEGIRQAMHNLATDLDSLQTLVIEMEARITELEKRK